MIQWKSTSELLEQRKRKSMSESCKKPLQPLGLTATWFCQKPAAVFASSQSLKPAAIISNCREKTSKQRTLIMMQSPGVGSEQNGEVVPCQGAEEPGSSTCSPQPPQAPWGPAESPWHCGHALSWLPSGPELARTKEIPKGHVVLEWELTSLTF